MTNNDDVQQGRWRGRNMDKDVLRKEIWSYLEAHNIAIDSPFSRIPNFLGAEMAAERLSRLPIWKNARVVKCNPDPPQIPVRLRALQDGKLLYAPVPELVKDFPFVELDPLDLQRRDIPFENVAPSEGFLQYGRRVNFNEMQPFDLVIVGCVAVTRKGGRTGKGGGFADLELGIFREMGLIAKTTPIVTTVHSSQVVDNDRISMVEHDSALDWIITPDEVIETSTLYPQPSGVYWEMIQPDQYRDIPFLVSLRDNLTDELHDENTDPDQP
jgi:5-formyltetrahydrofolate cyclo-ligase